jgi:hypothetical protein
VAELKRLGDRELRLTLGQLSPLEREQVLALIEQPQSSKSPPASFETLVGFSPWLLKAIEAARQPGAGAKSVTPATRNALLEAFDQLVGKSSAGRSQHPAQNTFIGRMLARRKARLAAS